MNDIQSKISPINEYKSIYTWREPQCINFSAMSLLVGLVEGVGDGDGVDVGGTYGVAQANDILVVKPYVLQRTVFFSSHVLQLDIT